jgi:hypothetical protein
MSMDDDDVREELVRLLTARQEEHSCEEEALRRHEKMNDVLVETLRSILDRLDAIERRLGTTPD